MTNMRSACFPDVWRCGAITAPTGQAGDEKWGRRCRLGMRRGPMDQWPRMLEQVTKSHHWSLSKC